MHSAFARIHRLDPLILQHKNGVISQVAQFPHVDEQEVVDARQDVTLFCFVP